MAASRLASNLTEDYLTCSVCCEIFKDPRQLSCDHSFCLSCLLDYGQKCVQSGQIKCPICRTANSCPSGVEFCTWIKSLPSDLLLMAILTTVQNHDSNSLIPKEESVFSEKESTDGGECQSFCTKHESNIMDVYCFTHALLLCATCAWIDHAQCLSFPLDDCSEKLNGLITQLMTRFDKLSNRIIDLKLQGGQSKDMIVKSKSSSQASLREIQEVLQQFWSKAQLNVQHLAQSIHQRDNDVLNMVSSVNVIQDDILHLTQDLGKAKETGDNVMKTIQLLHESDKRIQEHYGSLNNIGTVLDRATSFHLDTNEDLLEFCSNFQTVGILKSNATENICVQSDDLSELELFLKTSAEPLDTASNTTSKNTPTATATDITRNTEVTSENATTSTGSNPDLEQSCGSVDNSSLSNDDEGFIHVAGKRGSTASVSSTALFESFSHRAIHVHDNVRGIFTLSDLCIVGDHVIVVDQYNSLVMKFDVSSGVCVEKLTVMEPHHIALIPDSSCVLFTCWSLNEIYTVEVEPILQVKGEPLKTSKHYIGIHVYNRQRMLVSALDKSIDVIDFHGQVIHSIRPRYHTVLPGIFGGNCILVPADLCLLSEDSILVLDGVRKSIVAVHFSGKILWSKHIDGLSGFTVFNGTVYVCNSKSNTIMTLSKDGKIRDRHFLSKFIGIKRPWALDVRENITVVSEDSPSGIFHIVIVDSDGLQCEKPE
ncbi:LOW QUALITY PROTEIN: uncharacterized protein [Argopecten irradians]|uniref:LOW QUALITY PROTEIN: uncharacterized protein n=1 Tax=Argopecten irradians TaxID=31199 RepID=UPI003722F600